MYSTSIFQILLAFSISIFQPGDFQNELTDLGLKIQQGENTIQIISSEQTIEIDKEKFSVIFNLKRDDDIAEKFYAARLVADIDPDIFKQFEVDKRFEEIPALSVGTSMAGPKNDQYECIFFDDQAHHYIFYNNEDEKRAKLISKDDNGVLQLSFEVENYCMQDLEVNIKNSNFENLYFVFFIDENLNEKIEEGEFVKLEVAFKE